MKHCSHENEGITAMHNDIDQTGRHVMLRERRQTRSINTTSLQLYKINQAKLIYSVKGWDHSNLCQEVSDGKEARGAFGSSGNVLFLYLVLIPWVRFLCENPSSCLFTIRVLFCMCVMPQ